MCEERRLRNIASASKNRAKKKAHVDAHKMSSGCTNPSCPWVGYFHPCQLHLDHIDPKLKSPRLKVNNTTFWHLGWELMLEEIKKCQVLCANCHMAKTHVR
jgi:hypothetical protein